MTFAQRIGALLLCFFALPVGATPATVVDWKRASGACEAASPLLQSLAKVVNTRDDTYHCLGVSVDAQSDITAVRFETHEFAEAEANHGPIARSVHIRAFSPDEIARTEGVVLDGTPGHDAVILQGDIVPGQMSATLKLRFLHNGLTGEFHECSVTLDRANGASWRLVDSGHGAIRQIVVKTWAVPVLGTIGIDTVEGICP